VQYLGVFGVAATAALLRTPELPDIVDGQVALAGAAAQNGVRRFLPSDFAIDLFAAPEGAPQFDMRRRADSVIDALPLEVVHVLNGAFMDMMLDPSTAAAVDLDHPGSRRRRHKPNPLRTPFSLLRRRRRSWPQRDRRTGLTSQGGPDVGGHFTPAGPHVPRLC